MTTLTDTRIDTAIDNLRAAVEAMSKAHNLIRELREEEPGEIPMLTAAAVDMRWATGKAENAIEDLRRAKGGK